MGVLVSNAWITLFCGVTREVKSISSQGDYANMDTIGGCPGFAANSSAAHSRGRDPNKINGLQCHFSNPGQS